MTGSMASRPGNSPPSVSTLRVGDRVRVRSKDEILATLDSDGRVDGMPFMPEMLAFAGRTFPVDAVTHRTCDTVKTSGTSGTTRRLERAVHLQDLRCDGSAHGGCQARCMLFWKEDWLEVVPPGQQDAPDVNGTAADVPAVLQAATRARPVSDGEAPTYSCQATELLRATSFVSARNLDMWIKDVRSRNASVRAAIAGAAIIVFNKWQGLSKRLPRSLRVKDGRPWPWYAPTGEMRTFPTLDLRPGELVEVRSKQEIESTLNERGEVRGLRFSAEMLKYCGTRARVVARVDKIIDEKTGKMLNLRDCIILENSWCDGSLRALCRRKIFTYWRESWLRRVDQQDVMANGQSGRP